MRIAAAVTALLLAACGGQDPAPHAGARSEDLRSAPEATQGKVTICHIPPGNPENRHEITVGVPAVQAHLNHGDFVGTCEPSCKPAGSRCRTTEECCPGLLCVPASGLCGGAG
jgi:hypothetical protein